MLEVGKQRNSIGLAEEIKAITSMNDPIQRVKTTLDLCLREENATNLDKRIVAVLINNASAIAKELKKLSGIEDDESVSSKDRETADTIVTTDDPLKKLNAILEICLKKNSIKEMNPTLIAGIINYTQSAVEELKKMREVNAGRGKIGRV